MTKIRFGTISAAGVMFGLSVGSASAQNLLVNGSFETVRGITGTTQGSIIGQAGTNATLRYMPITLSGATTTDSVRLTGWTIKYSGIGSTTNFGIDIVERTWAYNGKAGNGLGHLTNNGFQSICLNSTASASITQTITVTAGKRYAIDYWRAASPSQFPNATSTLNRQVLYDVVVDGVVVLNDKSLGTNQYVNSAGVNTARSLTDMGWEFVHHEFVASRTGAIDLTFASQTAGNSGIALDGMDVHVMVPEPSTFAFAVLGLLPLGYVIRRRTKLK